MTKTLPAFFTKPSGLADRCTLTDWLDVPNTNSIAKAMDLARYDINEVVHGRSCVAYLTGPPGVGKTHLINEAIASWEKTGISPIRCQPATKTELIGHFEESGGVIPLIMEEMDLLFRSGPTMEVFKLATDLNGSREIEKGKGEDRKIVPLSAPIIVTANINIKILDRAVQDQAKALFDRQPPTVIPHNIGEQWEWTVYLALTTDILKQVSRNKISHGISWKIFDETINWFTDNIWNIEHVSPRVLKLAAEYISRNHHALDMSDREKELNLQRLCRPNKSTRPIPIKCEWSLLRRQYLAKPVQAVAANGNAASLLPA